MKITNYLLLNFISFVLSVLLTFIFIAISIRDICAKASVSERGPSQGDSSTREDREIEKKILGRQYQGVEMFTVHSLCSLTIVLEA